MCTGGQAAGRLLLVALRIPLTLDADPVDCVCIDVRCILKGVKQALLPAVSAPLVDALCQSHSLQLGRQICLGRRLFLLLLRLLHVVTYWLPGAIPAFHAATRVTPTSAHMHAFTVFLLARACTVQAACSTVHQGGWGGGLGGLCGDV